LELYIRLATKDLLGEKESAQSTLEEESVSQ